MTKKTEVKEAALSHEDHPGHGEEQQWDPERYQQHSYVYEQGSTLITWLRPQRGERILDLGCGSGQLSWQIQQQGAEVLGIDHSAEMIRAARSNYPDTNFVLQSAYRMHDQEAFDAVFSNAALHWMKQAKRVISNVVQALKPNGRFVAEMGGERNIAQLLQGLRQALTELGFSEHAARHPWFFPSAAEYATLLEEQGLRVARLQHYRRHITLPGKDGLAQWIAAFAPPLLAGLNKTEKGQVVQHCEQLLRSQHSSEDSWIADYWRLRFVAIKDRNCDEWPQTRQQQPT